MSTTKHKLARRQSARRPFRLDQRGSGLLLHPTSLPGPHGGGDIGDEALRFADFLASAGQRWWQMLPVNPPSAPPGNCPYSSTSAFAGSPWLISLDRLAAEGLLERTDVQPSNGFNGSAAANLALGRAFREARLRKAFDAFVATARRRNDYDRFIEFCADQRQWLDDFALYCALKDAHHGAAWTEWSRDLRMRHADALRQARQSMAAGVRFHQFVQFVFQTQWASLKSYCNARDIGLIGDIPIFVAHDSADVWAHRDLFLLDESGQPTTVSGYPPDAFNSDGQKWGHPHYNWEMHEKTGFKWWIARFRRTLQQFDAARIDHFLGFDRAWHIPGRARTARRGRWIAAPGDRLFAAVREALGPAQIIAEDLGKLTAPAAALRDKFRFPGMRVMQFGFGDGGEYHLPHAFARRCVAYTGTHDNQTIAGWHAALRRRAPKGAAHRQELRKLKRYLELDGQAIHWPMIRAAMMSAADTVIFPVQDLLGLGDEARMNIPGTANGNWGWRLRWGQLTDDVAARLRDLAHLYGRI
jgi:4-alpha-glucanotransferase